MTRSQHNPIIKPQDIKPSQEGFEVIGVFNPAAARVGNEIILLLRIAERPTQRPANVEFAPVYDPDHNKTILKEFSKQNPQNGFSDLRLIKTPQGTYLTSISHLRVARSIDGINFKIDQSPVLFPANEYETFGIEDPRITLIDGVYYITYVAVSPHGVTTALTSTRDFRNFERHGIIFHPDNKDVVLLPAQIGPYYYALHRPASALFASQDMWIAQSPDLISWGNHKLLMSTRPNHWDEQKIGAGAVPFETNQGWLEIYHGADRNNRYCLGAVLLDKQKPWLIKTRSTHPVFEPTEPYECEGFFGNVVFTCGLLAEKDTVKLYYGAADTSICYAELSLFEILDTMS